MDFSKAFAYPYNNLPRVLMITLAFAMIIAVMYAIMLNDFTNLSVVILSIIIGLAQTLFLSGYSLRMMRNISQGEEDAPPFEVMDDIGQGIRIIIASIAYMLPIVLIFLVVGLMTAIGSGSRDAAGGLALAMLCVVVIMIPVMFLLGWALQIAIVRYALEGDGLFEYSTNIRLARENIGPAFSLFFRQILLGIVYGIITAIVNSIYQSIALPTISFRTPHSIIVLVLTLGTVISTTLSILSQFSTYHLVTQFGMMIGLGQEKPKPIDPDQDAAGDY